MDHLLRNRRLGSLATPVSNPFFIAAQVYFLHRLSLTIGRFNLNHVVLNDRHDVDNLASMEVLNVSNMSLGAEAFTVMVAPRLK